MQFTEHVASKQHVEILRRAAASTGGVHGDCVFACGHVNVNVQNVSVPFAWFVVTFTNYVNVQNVRIPFALFGSHLH